MKTAKQKDQVSSVSPSLSYRFPFKRCVKPLKAYFAFRGLDYHFRQDYKPIFFQDSTSTE